MMTSTTTLNFVAAFFGSCYVTFLALSAQSNATGLNPTSPCNGNGLVYRDSNFTRCECFQCFTGIDCSDETQDCVIIDTSGNPKVYQEYWVNVTNISNALTSLTSTSTSTVDSATISDPYYRSPYQSATVLLDPQPNPLPPSEGIDAFLRKVIMDVHALVGNVNADYISKNYYIVIGHGCTQLINAAIYALGKTSENGGPCTVFAQTPFYHQYQSFAEFNPAISVWNASYNMPDTANIVEFVTVPNNPDGTMRVPHYKNARYVYDMVYNWPSLVETTKNAEHDIMLFSVSKLSGHAGTRMGWALVRNEHIAREMSNFVALMAIHPSIDAIYRSYTILSELAYNNQLSPFFNDIKQVMHYRWQIVTDIFAQQTKYQLHSQFGTFFLWISTDDDSVDLYQVFATGAKILGESGTLFGGKQNYLRLEMVMRSSTFALFQKRLANFMLNQ